MAGKARRVQEAVDLRRLADERIVVRGDLIEARPAAAQLNIVEHGGAPLHEFGEQFKPRGVLLGAEAPRVFNLRSTQQQTSTFGMEVVAGRKVDRERQPARVEVHRFAHHNVTAQRFNRQVNAHVGTDFLRPRSGRAHHGVSGNRSSRCFNTSDPAGAGLRLVPLCDDAGDFDPAEDRDPQPAGVLGVAGHSGLGSAVGVEGVESAGNKVVGADDGVEFAAFSRGNHARRLTQGRLKFHVGGHLFGIGFVVQQKQVAGLDHVDVLAHLLFKSAEDLQAARAEHDVRFVRELAAQTTGSTACGTAGQFAALNEHNVFNTGLCQFVRSGCAHDAAADDDHGRGRGNSLGNIHIHESSSRRAADQR